MEIAILRHGKPVIPNLKPLSAMGFSSWVRDYNLAPLSDSSRPTSEAQRFASRCCVIVCSKLRRSIDSAKALNGEKILVADELLAEAELPIAAWHRPKLSPGIWAVIFRVLWFLGYSRGSESFREAKARANRASKMLIALAEEHQSVLFVGHGVFNRLVANELRKAGWIGPNNPGSKHWAFGVYRR